MAGHPDKADSTLRGVAALTCHRCGRTGEQHALDWSTAVVDDRSLPLCGACTRRHLRDIESKLDETWWVPPSRAVLVVEDDADTRLLIRMSLESAGYVVDGVATGEEALEHLATRPPPSVIVVDVGLPGTVDGWDVRERARSLAGEVPVIVISPEATPEHTGAHDDVDFLRKPFEMDRLVTLVGRRSGDQAGAGLA